MSSPSRITCPLVGVSRPANRPRSVLFPLPDGPIMAANWPRGISRSMPLRISTRWVPVSMDLVSARTSIKPLLWHSDAQILFDRLPGLDVGMRQAAAARAEGGVHARARNTTGAGGYGFASGHRVLRRQHHGGIRTRCRAEFPRFAAKGFGRARAAVSRGQYGSERRHHAGWPRAPADGA